MKNLSAVFVMLFLSLGMAHAEKSEDVDRYRGYTDNFIFNEGGIEFAVFPDGQFDFNFLDYGPQFGVNANLGNVNISFNTGFDYDRYVQYDTYGAVIQIENTPIYYDEFGRIIQAGNVLINYRNGYVHNIGNLYVNYARPGVILNYRGYINNFNRFYTFRPWHRFYAAPYVSNCVVFARPYRTFYNPIRFSFAYHRNYWNSPVYYNGRYGRNGYHRSFHRPYDRVVYRDYERGRRNKRGRAIATGRRAIDTRNAYATGRKSLNRSNDNVGRRASQSRNGRSSGLASRSSQNRKIGNNDRAGRSVNNNRSTGRSSNGRATTARNGRSSDNKAASRTTRGISNRSGVSSRENSRSNTSRGNVQRDSRSAAGNRKAVARDSRGTSASRSRGSDRKSSARTSRSDNRGSSARTSSNRGSRARTTAPKRSNRSSARTSAPKRSQSKARTSSSQRSQSKARSSAPKRSSSKARSSRGSSSKRSSGRTSRRG